MTPRTPWISYIYNSGNKSDGASQPASQRPGWLTGRLSAALSNSKYLPEVTGDPSNKASEAAERILTNFPSVQITRAPGCLTVAPAYTTGFRVSLLTDSGRVTLMLGGWYDDFQSTTLALGFFESALVGNIRVRVESLNGTPVQWTIERMSPSQDWEEIGSMSALGNFSKCNRTTSYLRNFHQRSR